MSNANNTTYPSAATLAMLETHARMTFKHMSRKQFNSLLYDLYRCKERGVSNDAKADFEYNPEVVNNLYSIEVFNSPEGPIIAFHYGRTLNDVDVIRIPLIANDVNNQQTEDLLNSRMPDGRSLRDWTGKECGVYGKFLCQIAAGNEPDRDCVDKLFAMILQAHNKEAA